MALVLMYHNIVAGEAERSAFHPAHRPYVLTEEEFAAHVEIALARGWRFAGVDELCGAGPRDGRALVATFDDSWENGCAVRAMGQRGIKGVFFLNSGEIGMPGRVTAAEVASMAAEGHEIGSHGVGHEFLTRLDDARLGRDLSESRRTLAAMSGKPVRFLSAPGGRYDSRVARAARGAGYEAFFVSLPGFAGRIGGDFIVKRISIAARVDADAFGRMLDAPLPFVLRRKVKYRLSRLSARFSHERGDEGH